ncbi:MAG: KH domain-containing protein [Candidatus Eisenbacteria bacterium]
MTHEGQTESAVPETGFEIAELIRRMVKVLVNTPEQAEVECQVGRNELQCYVRVAPGEAGQVVGRHGRNIAALRDIAGCVAAPEGLHVRIDIDG